MNQKLYFSFKIKLMKFIITLFVLGTCFSYLYGQTNEQIIKSEIKKVKLYLTSGEMTHETDLKVQKGRNKLIFSGISAFADQRSIQFVTDNEIRIVSISTEIDFSAAEAFNPKIKVLKDTLEVLKDQLQNNKDILSAYHAEQAVLNTNRDIKGTESLTAEKIKAVADYYRTRTLEINRTVSKLTKEQEYLNARIYDTRLQLTEFNFIENQRSNQVIILVDSDKPESIHTTLKYQVSDCGWAPTYDLSVQDINQPVNLKYKAQVYNNTGNEWKQVELTLSTSDPLMSAASPLLNPFYITYGNMVEEERQKYIQPTKKITQSRAEVMNEINMANQRAYDNYYLDGSDQKVDSRWKNENSKVLEVKKVTTVAMKTIELSDLNAEFNIPHVFSCPTDAKPYTVEIKDLTIPATFAHISVPKLDQGAFLIAKIVGWQELDLIPGPTNVYFGGNYVGVSEINTRNVSDTLELSFGRDSKIQVLRKLKSEMSVKRSSGSYKRDTYYYDVQIRNNRSTPITIDIFDQIPLSRNNEITISVEELSGGKLVTETGEISYKLVIAPGETKNLVVGYTIKYPKNSKVNLRSFRTISCPAF